MAMTPWASSLLDDANQLMLAGHNKEALTCLVTALSVHPNQPELRRAAAELIYIGMRRDQASPLTGRELLDSRLDSLFCSCDEPGCTASWVSVGQFMTQRQITVNRPRGVRCVQCGGYFCRRHYTTDIVGVVRCPRCGGAVESAPREPNGRRRTQTVRLNQPLVHVLVLREGPRIMSPDYMTGLLDAIAPDVNEDRPTISGVPIRRWSEPPEDLALALLARDNGEYLAGEFDVYTDNGVDDKGIRWAVVKVFSRMPKVVDPDAE